MVAHVSPCKVWKVNAGGSGAEGQGQLCTEFKPSLESSCTEILSHACPKQPVKQSKKSLSMMLYAHNASACTTKARR